MLISKANQIIKYKISSYASNKLNKSKKNNIKEKSKKRNK